MCECVCVSVCVCMCVGGCNALKKWAWEVLRVCVYMGLLCICLHVYVCVYVYECVCVQGVEVMGLG